MEQSPIQNFREKDNFITITSFLCAIMIIGLHSYSIGDSDKYSVSAVIPGILSHGLFTAAVPIFMFTSGYLFYKNTESIKDCFAKQKRRIVSLVLPFFAWSTLYYMVYFVGNTVLGGVDNG